MRTTTPTARTLAWVRFCIICGVCAFHGALWSAMWIVFKPDAPLERFAFMAGSVLTGCFLGARVDLLLRRAFKGGDS